MTRMDQSGFPRDPRRPRLTLWAVTLPVSIAGFRWGPPIRGCLQSRPPKKRPALDGGSSAGPTDRAAVSKVYSLD